MSELNQTFGFTGYSKDLLAELADLIAARIGIPSEGHENFDYGDYFLYDLGRRGLEHLLVWNEVPEYLPDPDEAPDPDFLDWKCIFWVAEGHESDSLTNALLSIPGARLLRSTPNNAGGEQ